MHRIAGLLVPVAGCVAQAPEAERPRPPSLLEQAEGEDFLQTWVRPPGWERDRIDSRSPHGAESEVLLSPAFFAATERGEPLERWPAGVAAVALGYHEGAEDPWLTSLSRKDDDGWHWQQVDDRGRVLVDGRVDACLGCHGAAGDFVFAIALPEE